MHPICNRAAAAQTFSSPPSDLSAKPVWSVGRNLVLQKGEATLARIAVTNITKSGRVRSTTKRQLVGCCPARGPYPPKRLHRMCTAAAGVHVAGPNPSRALCWQRCSHVEVGQPESAKASPQLTSTLF